jgi:Restriction endonuclease
LPKSVSIAFDRSHRLKGFVTLAGLAGLLDDRFRRKRKISRDLGISPRCQKPAMRAELCTPPNPTAGKSGLRLSRIGDRTNVLLAHFMRRLAPDATAARDWYQRAVELGSREAAARLDRPSSPEAGKAPCLTCGASCEHQKRPQISAPEIRKFIGGRHARNDRCLFVSTSGFSVEGRYEAERSGVPLTLIDGDDLIELMLEHYEKTDAETRAPVPLRKIYWSMQNERPAY